MASKTTKTTKKTTKKKTVRRFSTAAKTTSYAYKTPSTKRRLIPSFRISESYTSLILGIFVVIISSLLLVSFLRNRTIGQINQAQQDISSAQTVAEQQSERTHTVVAGDDLWKIAEEAYNDGYKWREIAQANNITNPGELKVGQQLTLPEVTPSEIAQNTTTQETEKTPTPAPTELTPTPEPVTPTAIVSLTPTTTQNDQQARNTISGSTYTVQQGDHLWGIAERKYGNGYKWVDIATANNIATPDLIFPGTEIKLPQE